MGTLTSLLNLSQNGLVANQAAIDITSNNVANANTPGYTEQVAVWTENDTVSLGGSIAAGQGASISSRSLRDPVLNQRVQQQTQLESASSARGTALSDLQSVFGITASSTSAISTPIGSSLDGFFNSLSTLEASPSDASARQGVLSAASTLVTQLNTAAAQISQQTSGLNQQVSGTVSQVNSLTTAIASLNLQIEDSSPNADAGTLEDQRQQDITQLSQYIGFDQTKTGNNGLTLSIADGSLLVSDGQSYALSTLIVNGNTDLVAASGKDITASISGGSLGGIIQARDTDLPQVSAALDSLAYAIGTAVNTQNEAGLDGNHNPGAALFTLPASTMGAASTISVATTDPNAIAAAGAGQGATGNANVTALSALGNGAIVNGQSPTGYYSSLLTQVGSTVSEVNDLNSTQQSSLTQLTTQQSAQSSVSLDQEAANLTQYERSYDAAAKIFTIVDQLMASALNLGEETTVS